MSDQRPDDPRWLTEPPPPTAVPAEPIVTVGAGTTSEAGSTAGSSAPTTERASHAASEAKEQVKQVGSEAKEQAKQVGSEAKDRARELINQTQSELKDQAEQRTQRASQSLRTLAQQLEALQEGRTDEAGPVAQFTGQAQHQITQFAERLERGGADGLMADVSSFARRKPGVFLVTCAGVGFLVGRLARSQAGSDDRAGDRRRDTEWPATADQAMPASADGVGAVVYGEPLPPPDSAYLEPR